jgi:hypothetical protein
MQEFDSCQNEESPIHRGSITWDNSVSFNDYQYESVILFLIVSIC